MMKFFTQILFCLSCMLFFSDELSAKVRFLTFHCNRPEFIEIQAKTFKKFIQDEYEIIVFNDAKTDEGAEEIKQMCAKHAIPCVRYEQAWHRSDPINDLFRSYRFIVLPGHGFGDFDIETISNCAGIRHSHVIQYALDHFGYEHDDIVVLIDGDCFPIRKTNIRKLMNGADIVGSSIHMALGRGWWPTGDPKYSYLWVVFTAMDMPKLPNKQDLRFHMQVYEGLIYDTGSNSWKYLHDNPQVVAKKVKPLKFEDLKKCSMSRLASLGLTPGQIQLVRRSSQALTEFHQECHFLHYRGVSFRPDSRERGEYVFEYVGSILEN